jgi:hypothetical protein
MAALPLIVFDVNETLLDLETMEPTFERIFGEKSAMRLWFADLILYSAALTVAGCYVPFTDIGSAVMKMLADTRGIKIDDKDKKWDTLGAVAAGWEAALIKRVGNDVLGVGPQLEIVGDNLNDVANQLIARHKVRA